MTLNVFACSNSVFVFVNAFCTSMISTITGSTTYGEKVLPLNSKRVFPVCIGGQRPAPPEDSGGPRAYREEGDPRWRTWWDAIPREDLRLIAETVKRFLDSKGDRSVIEDRESLIAAVGRVKAHSDRRPDRIDRRAINQRLEQYARGERKWLFCDSIE